MHGPMCQHSAYVSDLTRHTWSVRGFSDSSDQDETRKEDVEPIATAEGSATLEWPPGLPGPVYDRNELLRYDDGDRHVCYCFHRMDGNAKVCVDLTRTLLLKIDLETMERTAKTYKNDFEVSLATKRPYQAYFGLPLEGEFTMGGSVIVLRKRQQDPECRTSAPRSRTVMSKNSLMAKFAPGKWAGTAEWWAELMYRSWRDSLGDLSKFDDLPPEVKSTMARRLRDMVRDDGIRIEVRKGLESLTREGGKEAFIVLFTWAMEGTQEHSRVWLFSAGTSERAAPNRAGQSGCTITWKPRSSWSFSLSRNSKGAPRAQTTNVLSPSRRRLVSVFSMSSRTGWNQYLRREGMDTETR